MLFETVPGTSGLRLDDVAHVLVPGRGRDDSGFGLNAGAHDRVLVASQLFEAVVRPAGGRIVCSGYKSPIDRKGTPWRFEGRPTEVFSGIPEAELMRRELIRLGTPEGIVSAECRSIDTVTNFLRADREGHFGDDRPVAIVAQADHLHRMLAVIAPRTLRRAYLGVVVPQQPPQPESRLATVASMLIAARLPADPDAAIGTATARAKFVWRVAQVAGMRSYH
jgi:hypothetical protein